LKAPWVDECYTYYGVWHDTLGEVYSSMLTGINFSPPLYFLFNFFIKLFYPTSIELLRVQSLIWALIGIIICFLFSRKSFGLFASLVGTLLVSSHSTLLFAQSQEARHYTMFFACGAWVLLVQSIDNKKTKKYLILSFLSHLCLCQVHYLGIVFSGLAGLSHLFSNRKKKFTNRIPGSLFLTWLVTLPIYLLLLSKQSSHLGNWPKPNGFSDLLTVYQSGIFALFSVIPILAIACFTQNPIQNNSLKKNYHNGVLLTSIFWYGVPFLFWVISHLLPINLFNERYFVPKEAALIFLVCFVCKRIVPISSKNGSDIKIAASAPVWAVLILCITLLFAHSRRSSFSYDEGINYHQGHLARKELVDLGLPVIFYGDPVFFPNAYTNPDISHSWIKNDKLHTAYSQYSAKLNLVNANKLNELESFILVGSEEKFAQFKSDFFETQDLGKLNECVIFHCTLFDKKEGIKLPLSR
jgi:hypothetical protein